MWDYVGDNYVHRLIQSKTDGKLVEVPSPAPPGVGASPRRGGSAANSCNTAFGPFGGGGGGGGGQQAPGGGAPHGSGRRSGSSGAWGGGGGGGAMCSHGSQEYDGGSGGMYGHQHDDDPDMKEAMLASKLDHIAAGVCVCVCVCVRGGGGTCVTCVTSATLPGAGCASAALLSITPSSSCVE